MNHPKNGAEPLNRQGFPLLSAFTFAHRATVFGYPAVSCIAQALPLCHEVVVALSATPDPFNRALQLWARHEPKLRLVELDVGDSPGGGEGVVWWRQAYAAALSACRCPWVLRLDLDEFFHENDWAGLAAALQIAEDKGVAAIRTSFREVTADWRFALEPPPFDQIRIWHQTRATPAWDGSQAIPHGPVLDATRIRCWHLDLLLPSDLRMTKLVRSYGVHFPRISLEGRDPLYKHQLLEEQSPEVFARLAWRRPEALIYLGGAAFYPRALRHRPRWLATCTHPDAERLVRAVDGPLVPGMRIPLRPPGATGASGTGDGESGSLRD